MKVKEKLNLEDWNRMAVPQSDGSDSRLLLQYGKNCTLQIEPEAKENEPKLFNNRVALRHFEWHDDFLQNFEHAPFNHPSIREAEELIALWPEVYEQCGIILKAFNPMFIKGIDDKKDYGGSNSHQPKNTVGAAWATVHNPILLAQAFVHEMAHNKLFYLGQHFESQAPLFRNKTEELFDSPIRLDIPRPISAVFHGIYAFTHVLALDRILFEKAENYNGKEFLGLLRWNALRVKQGTTIIKKCAQLTPEGEAFVSGFLEWSEDEIAQALTIYQTHIKTEEKPVVIIGPNSPEKLNLANQLQEKTNRTLINADQLCWDIWTQSSVFKDKKLVVFGSRELIDVLEKSGKFSDKELLFNWIKSGVFDPLELEFMKLQLCNYLLKNFPDSVIYFDETHVFLQHPDFIQRLKQLFNEYNTTVIYAKPVLDIEGAVRVLDIFNCEERRENLRQMLNSPVYRTLCNYIFDTERFNEESINDLLSLVTARGATQKSHID